MSVLELCERSGEVWKQSAMTSTTDNAASVDAFDATPLMEEFNRALSFVKAGLRGVSRAGGETLLEKLAERLEWHGG